MPDSPRQEGDDDSKQGRGESARQPGGAQGKEQRRSRPRSPYRQQGPTGSWVDPYTKRHRSSLAFKRMSQEEIDAIVQRLRQPTVSSTGAKEQRDKEEKDKQERRKSAGQRTDEERANIAQRLFSANTRAWKARGEKNPNTIVHYSTDFTII
ncbi:hypothetical protein BOX15_Mlig018641g3 [Macrostomum lignano]|uniref:Uncharacterized protein n=2 Tax=Macrostomum lignano TaxID=282301 RepID=A0A267G3L8_9PLAT|nr:hypothetical protein BOX15_Mlig018641g3 [Macrostomum lignano]